MAKPKTTKDYLDEYVGIHKAICALKANDFAGLGQSKNSLLSLIERNMRYNILNLELSPSETAFLRNGQVADFSKAHIELEGLFIYHYKYFVAPALFSNYYSKYLALQMELARLSLLERYQQIPVFAHSDEKGKVIFGFLKCIKGVVSFDNAVKVGIKPVIFEGYWVKGPVVCKEETVVERRRRLQSAKGSLLKQLSKADRVPSKLFKPVEDEFAKFLREYAETVQANYFEFKDSFAFYNQEVKAYIVNIGGWYHMLPYLQKASRPSCSLVKHVLPVASIFNFNQEESDKDVKWYPGSVADTIPEFKKAIQNQGKTVHEEAFEIFWGVSSKDEKVLLLKKLFKLLGYRLEDIGQDSRMFRVGRSLHAIDGSRQQDSTHRSSLIVWSDAVRAHGANVKQIIDEAIRWREKDNIQDIYFISDEKYVIEPRLHKLGITCLSIPKVIRKLFETNLGEFIVPFVRQVVISKGRQKVAAAVRRRQEGERYISELKKINPGHLHFKKFEDLVSNIFAFLLRDSFRNYHSVKQTSEDNRHKIRDLVISNAAPLDDFWKERRQDERAHRIIVDCKNYTEAITQDQVLSITKYFDNKLGKFGMIVCKSAVAASALIEQKQLYRNKDELILVVSEDDLIRMIYQKINNQRVEDVLEEMVSDLSM